VASTRESEARLSLPSTSSVLDVLGDECLGRAETRAPSVTTLENHTTDTERHVQSRLKQNSNVNKKSPSPDQVLLDPTCSRNNLTISLNSCSILLSSVQLTLDRNPDHPHAPTTSSRNSGEHHSSHQTGQRKPVRSKSEVIAPIRSATQGVSHET
jgi:hypothetical protein